MSYSQVPDRMGQLSILASSLVVLRQKTHTYHLVLKGTISFKELHKLFEHQYQHILDEFDTISEYMVIKGFAPPMNLSECLKKSFIREVNEQPRDINQILEELLRDNVEVVKFSADIRTDDDRVLDNILSGLEAFHDKQGWFLRSYIIQ
jgi:DNA-binding ferritin-like protein